MKTALLFVILIICAFGDSRSLRRRTRCRKAPRKININVRSNNIIDLTHTFDENAAHWPTIPFGFELTELFKGFMDASNTFVSMNTLHSAEHAGTHMDAPVHFYETGRSVEQLSLHTLIGTGVLLNLKDANGNRFGRDSEVRIEHFQQWEVDHERTIRSGSIVLLYTGYGDVYDNYAEYWGTNETGPGAVPFIRFPGLHPDAADWLIHQRCVAAIGIDTPSVDKAQATDFRSHVKLTASGVHIFENVANLDQLSATNKDFTVVALSQKIGGGTGAPIRIIAVTI